MAKRTIILEGITRCIYNEAKINSAVLYPGSLVKKDSNGELVPHDVRGGKAERMFLREDSIQGNTYTTIYADDEPGQYYTCPAGTVLQGRLKAGENVAINDLLISYGDGTLCKAASKFLANIAAVSTTVTNTVAETTFSNGTVTIPKNTLKVGDIIRVRGAVTFPSTNSTDTATIKVKIGTDIVLQVPATDVANSDIAFFDTSIFIRTIGAAGTYGAIGTFAIGADQVGAVKEDYLASTTLDTTAAASLTVTVTWSVASASNQAILQMLVVEQVKGGTSAGADGQDIIGKVKVASDLSLSAVDGLVEFTIMD
jgi:hypothetical protein